ARDSEDSLNGLSDSKWASSAHEPIDLALTKTSEILQFESPRSSLDSSLCVRTHVQPGRGSSGEQTQMSRLVAGVMVWCLALAGSVFAQSTTTVSGVVTDSSEA